MRGFIEECGRIEDWSKSITQLRDRLKGIEDEIRCEFEIKQEEYKNIGSKKSDF